MIAGGRSTWFGGRPGRLVVVLVTSAVRAFGTSHGVTCSDAGASARLAKLHASSRASRSSVVSSKQRRGRSREP
jgi:hypothetical protein